MAATVSVIIILAIDFPGGKRNRNIRSEPSSELLNISP